jgi:hypothetical protein
LTDKTTSGKVSVAPERMRLNEEGTEGVFLGTKCDECGLCVFGDSVFCVRCTSSDLKAVDLSPDGTLYSYTIIHAPPAGWKGPVPYILGSVKLPEGPQVLSEVIDLDPGAVEINMPMKMVLRAGEADDEGREIMVYKWQPTTTG